MSLRLLCMADLSAYPAGRLQLETVGEVVELPPRQELLLERICEFDGFFTSLGVQTDHHVLLKAARLRLIASPTTGLDHIDVRQAEQLGIVVVSLREETDLLNKFTATAEMAWALLLATVRHLPSACSAVNRGIWDRESFRGTQLSGKTLGIVGYGRLGKMLGEYGKVFGMRVLVCDPLVNVTRSGIDQVSFDTLLSQSDVISIHVHLTDETRHLFDDSAFRRMKKGAILINTSRGDVIDESALLAALESGHLAGAGLDVISGERSGNLHLHPLIQYAGSYGNLVITPHLGGATFESQSMALERTIQKILNFFRSTP